MFGTVLSALFLDQKILKWKNVAALGRVCLGVWLVTQEEKPVQAGPTGFTVKL